MTKTLQFRSRRVTASAAIIGRGKGARVSFRGQGRYVDAGGARLACWSRRQGRHGRVRTALRRDAGETLWGAVTYLGKARTGRGGHAGDLSQGLEDGGQVRSDAGESDHLDGGQ